MATKKVAAAPVKKAGTAVAVKKTSGGQLVDIKAAMAAELATLAGRTAPAGGDKIQLKGKMFHLPDGSQHTELDVVIVDFISVNNFYEGNYDPKNITSPVCFAIGQQTTTMVPSDNSPVKQSDACSACPMNQYGSASVGQGKACKNMRRLAVLPPDGDEDSPLMIIDASPTSIKSFDGYVRTTSAKFGVMPVGLVTTISFNDQVDYAQLVFGNPQPNENVNAHWARRGEALERLTQEPDVSGYVAAPPARGARKAVAAKR